MLARRFHMRIADPSARHYPSEAAQNLLSKCGRYPLGACQILGTDLLTAQPCFLQRVMRRQSSSRILIQSRSYGDPAAFATLALAGLAGFALLWLAMPET
jgi:hypothetical protein